MQRETNTQLAFCVFSLQWIVGEANGKITQYKLSNNIK